MVNRPQIAQMTQMYNLEKDCELLLASLRIIDPFLHYICDICVICGT